MPQVAGAEARSVAHLRHRRRHLANKTMKNLKQE
jgi:hypothetical protein